jgi:hypothetical protein
MILLYGVLASSASPSTSYIGFLVHFMYGPQINALLMTIFVILCFLSRSLIVSSPQTQTMDLFLTLDPGNNSSAIGTALES